MDIVKSLTLPSWQVLFLLSNESIRYEKKNNLADSVAGGGGKSQ